MATYGLETRSNLLMIDDVERAADVVRRSDPRFDDPAAEFAILQRADAALTIGGEGIGVTSSRGDTVYCVTYEGRTSATSDAHVWECTCPARVTCKHIKRVAKLMHDLTDASGGE